MRLQWRQRPSCPSSHLTLSMLPAAQSSLSHTLSHKSSVLATACPIFHMPQCEPPGTVLPVHTTLHHRRQPINHSLYTLRWFPRSSTSKARSPTKLSCSSSAQASLEAAVFRSTSPSHPSWSGTLPSYWSRPFSNFSTYLSIVFLVAAGKVSRQV